MNGTFQAQAKTLTKGRVDATLAYLAATRNPTRNRLLLLLSARVNLRAKEIAGLDLDDDKRFNRSDRVHGKSGAEDTAEQRHLRGPDQARDGGPERSPYVIKDHACGTSPKAIVNMFQRWYRHLGFGGCSSHSGRRTFITNAARKISTVGASLRDVQGLAAHSNLRTTQRYIDVNPDAQVKVVGLV